MAHRIFHEIRMNAKVLFHDELVEKHFPSIEACAHSIALAVQADAALVMDALKCLDLEEQDEVDENMFLDTYLTYLTDPTCPSEKVGRSLCTSICERCKRLCLAKDFLCDESASLRFHCYRCRRKPAACLVPPFIYSRCDGHLDSTFIGEAHRMNLDAAEVLGKGLDCAYICTPFGSNGIKNDKEALKSIFEKVEGVRYILDKVGKHTTRWVCSQRADTKRRKKQSASVSSSHPQLKRRKRESSKTEDCHGSMSIKVSSGRMFVFLSRDYVHERLATSKKLSKPLLEEIERAALNGKTPFDIVTELSKSSSEIFTRSQVYYRWNEAIQKRYKRSDDVKKSARELLRESSEFDEIFVQEEPFAIGFTCRFAAEVCENFDIAEAHIDSTYKTNSSKFELFGVLGSFLGSGFPVAYLFLEAGQGDAAYSQRKCAIRDFLKCLKQRMKDFSPSFFFTDKDFGQIGAIHEIYGVLSCLCLWHVIKSVRRKMSDLSSDGSLITKGQRTEVIRMITAHFNSHPYLFGETETISSLYVKNWQEASAFCKINGLHTLEKYLWENWYRWERYVIWGRRNNFAVPLTRTNMKIEAHWSLIKRVYLVHNNRPRVDFIIYVLQEQLLPRVRRDHKMLLTGAKKPRWWFDFVSEWKKASSKTINDIYLTSNECWRCSCPAFLTGRFFFCKHLVRGRSPPEYRELIRNRAPPFLEFRRDAGRYIPEIGSELRNSLQVKSSVKASEDILNLADHDSIEHYPAADECRSMVSILKWMGNHVAGLSETEAGRKQLVHFRDKVLRMESNEAKDLFSRLNKYRKEIERTDRQLTMQKTFSHPHTVYYP